MALSTEHGATHRALQFLVPSWLSGLVSIIIPVLGVGAAIVLRSRGSFLYEGLTGISQAEANAPYGYQALSTWVDHNALVSNLPLFILWAVVGCAAYLFAVELFKLLTNAVDLKRRMHYVHADARQILLSTLGRLVLRLVDAAGICALAWYTLYSLLPLSLADAGTIAMHPEPATAGREALDTVLLAASFVVLTALLRLFMFRTRLFGA